MSAKWSPQSAKHHRHQAPKNQSVPSHTSRNELFGPDRTTNWKITDRIKMPYLHLYWTRVGAGVNLVRSWINKTVMYCFMHCLAFLLRQLKCMTRADAMRGSWWWIFDIIFSLKLMWDSQNDFIIIISGHVHVPFLGSQRDRSQMELSGSRGKKIISRYRKLRFKQCAWF